MNTVMVPGTSIPETETEPLGGLNEERTSIPIYILLGPDIGPGKRRESVLGTDQPGSRRYPPE